MDNILLPLTKHALSTGIILLSTRTHTAYEPNEDLDALNLLLCTFQSFPCELLSPVTEHYHSFMMTSVDLH